MSCPLCQAVISHPTFKSTVDALVQLRDDVEAKAMQRLVYEGLTKCADLTTPSSTWYKKEKEYVMHRYSYSLCNSCKVSLHTFT